MSELNYLIKKFLDQELVNAPDSDTVDANAVTQRVTDALLDSVNLRDILKQLVARQVNNYVNLQRNNATNAFGRQNRLKAIHEATERTYTPRPVQGVFVPVKTNEAGNAIHPAAVGRLEGTFAQLYRVRGELRKFGTLTLDEVYELVFVREEKAAENLAKAEQYRRVAQLMEKTGAQVVADLDEVAVLNVMGDTHGE